MDLIAGVDEVGRGPLAGPVVAAAVILDPNRPIDGLKDSKQLSAQKRETLAVIIKEQSLFYAFDRPTQYPSGQFTCDETSGDQSHLETNFSVCRWKILS